MKKIPRLFALTILTFALAAQSAQLFSAVRAYRFGNITTDTVADGIGLYASALSGNYDVAKSAGSSHAVATGKTLYISYILASTDTNTSFFSLTYGDNAISDAAGPPTNNTALTSSIRLVTANVLYEIPVFATVPAGKYLHVNASVGRVIVHIPGHEI